MNHQRVLPALLGLFLGGCIATQALAHPGHGAPEPEPEASEPTADTPAITHRQRSPHQRQEDRRHQRRGPGHPMTAIDLPPPAVSISIEGKKRVIRANGLPGHETGTFPNPGNPNALRPQSHEFTLPLVPTIAGEPIPARPEFGIAINGVVFDAGTGEFWTPQHDRAFGGGSPWNYEALGGGVPLGLDRNNAHVQPTGKYHYHGLPTGLVERLTEGHGGDTMVLIGWAYDGFPIYAARGHADAGDPASPVRRLRSSYRLKDGHRPDRPEGPGGPYDGTFGLDYEYIEGHGDLDECNGRYGVTPEFPHGTYYYVITAEFPSVPRVWRGEPDESVHRRGPGSGPTNEDPPDNRQRRSPRP
ncbi:MAG: YHYH protein [Planctomycetota bacterium]